MPAAGDRPKTRQLVRWNDDLDKSLLLHIAYTCTDLGIKVPYDEIAKRMGATFTEGAIQQHLAKLRAKMAEQNVAPVPPPPKRGQVTKKPSTVYGQKQRAVPPPGAPAASKAQARRQAATAQPDGSAPRGVTKGRGRKKANSRKIKRSSSDPAESADEFAGDDDADFENVQINNHSRGRRAQNAQANTGRRLSDNIQFALSQADATFEAQNLDENYEANGIFVPQEADPGEVYHGQEAAYPGQWDGQYVGGDEEEEEDLGQMGRGAAVQQMNTAGDFSFLEAAQYGQEEQLSPTSVSQTVNHSMPQMQTGFGGFDGRGQQQHAYFHNDQMHGHLPQVQGWVGINEQHFTMPPPSTPMRTPAAALGPSPAMPTPVSSHAYSQVGSTDLTRQNSMISQASSQGTPTPQHFGGFDGHMSLPNTPQGQTFQNNMANDFPSVDPAISAESGAWSWSDENIQFPAPLFEDNTQLF